MIQDRAQRALVLPGGHLHWNESVEEGIRREVFEETGYIVEPDEVLAVCSGPQAPVDRGIVRVIMSAKVIGGVETSSAEGEVAWPTLQEACEDTSRDSKLVVKLRDAKATSASIA